MLELSTHDDEEHNSYTCVFIAGVILSVLQMHVIFGYLS